MKKFLLSLFMILACAICLTACPNETPPGPGPNDDPFKEPTVVSDIYKDAAGTYTLTVRGEDGTYSLNEDVTINLSETQKCTLSGTDNDGEFDYTISDRVIKIGTALDGGIINGVINIDGAFYVKEGPDPFTVDSGLGYAPTDDGFYMVRNARETSQNVTISARFNSINITEIADYGFYGCTALKQIIIHRNVKHIGSFAFMGCSGLSELTLPVALESIGIQAFDSSGLSALTIPDTVKEMGGAAFKNCASLLTVKIGSGLSTISAEAFEFDTGINTLTFSSSVKKIDNTAFYQCINLATVNFGGTINDWCNIEFGNEASNPMYNTGSDLDVDLYLNGSADPITSVEPQDGLIEVKKYAFYNNSKIQRVVLPASVRSIQNDAFHACTALTEVEMPVEGVTEIGDNAFYACTELSSLVLPDTLESMSGSALTHCDALTGTIINQASYIGNDRTPAILLVKAEPTITQCIVEQTTKFINSSAFSGCSYLTNVTMPSGLIAAGDQLFNGCTSLEELEYPDGMKSLDTYMMCNKCTALTRVKLPECITEIGMSAFNACTLLTEVNIPKNVTAIATYAFNRCAISDISLPEGLLSIGTEAFNGCYNLNDFTMPNSVESISIRSFFNCPKLTNIRFSDSLKTIGESAFANCSGLTEISLPAGLTSIGEAAFQLCTGLKTIKFRGTTDQWSSVEKSNNWDSQVGGGKYEVLCDQD